MALDAAEAALALTMLAELWAAEAALSAETAASEPGFLDSTAAALADADAAAKDADDTAESAEDAATEA
jgi:hypothetical protein